MIAKNILSSGIIILLKFSSLIQLDDTVQNKVFKIHVILIGQPHVIEEEHLIRVVN